jgi:hypothetical protein
VKIHEYQGKAELGGHGVPVPRGKEAYKDVERRFRRPGRWACRWW